MAATSNTESISKLDAVRQALKALGKDAMPVKIQEFVKTSFDVDMSTAHVSNYKTMILRGGKTGKKRKKRRKHAVAAEVVAKPIQAPAKAANGAVTLAEIAAVKGLVSRVGEDTLKSLIDVFSK
jgi:hypothetical protein